MSKILDDILLHLAGLYPVGSVYITSSNTNPSSWLGGTWTLIRKSLKYQWLTLTDYVASYSSNTSSFNQLVLLTNGNTIQWRFSFIPNIAMSDTSTTYWTIADSYLPYSCSDIGYAIYCQLNDDVGNAIGQGSLTFNASNAWRFLNIAEWTTNGGSYSTATTSRTITGSVTEIIQDTTKLKDAYCDMFYWKRTA